LIPDIVARELIDSEAPPEVARWASDFPRWVSVRPTPTSAERLERLDAGERAAILLAEALSAAIFRRLQRLAYYAPLGCANLRTCPQP
jgi:hypothetical protein